MIKAFVKDSLIYTIPTIVNRGLHFILLPFYTRVLNPNDFGNLDLIIIFTSLINLTIALEISQGFARFLPDEKSSEGKKIISFSALAFTVCCYLIYLLVALIFLKDLTIIFFSDPNFDDFMLLGIVYSFINGLLYFFQNHLRFDLQSKNYAITNLSVSFLLAFSAIVFSGIFDFKLSGIIMAMIISNVFGCAISIYYLRKSYKLKISSKKLIKMLKFSFPLVFSSLSVYIGTYVDRIMINQLLSNYELGIYSLAFRVSSIILLLMVGIQMAITPIIYNNYKKPETRKNLEEIFSYFSAISIIFILSFCLFSREILMVFTTKEYFEAYILIYILAPSILLSQMYIFTPGLAIEKKTKIIFLISLIGALINTSLNLFLIPIYQIMGASVATLISSTFMFFSYYFISNYYYKLRYKIFRIIFNCIIIIFLSYFMINFIESNFVMEFLIRILLILISLVLIVFSGLVKVREIKSFKKYMNDIFLK